MADETNTTGPNLTILAGTAELVQQNLVQHTKNRKVLVDLFNSQDNLRHTLSLATFYDDGSNTVNVKLADLPKEYADLVVTTLIDHEEKKAVDCWNSLLIIAENAVVLIKQIQERRDQEDKSNESSGSQS